MQKLKIIESLKTLDKEEFKQFGSFLRSPIFNSNSNLTKLYNAISKYYPDFNEIKLRPEKVYANIFKGKKYNEKILLNLSAEMTHRFENFLGILEQREDPLRGNNLILSQLFKRRLFRLFEKKLEHSFELLDSTEIKDGNYYLNKYLLDMLKIDFINVSTPFNKLHQYFYIYSQCSDSLINYFLVVMLKEYLHIHNRKTNFKIEEEFKFIKEINHYLQENDNILKNEKLINLFYKFLKLYDEQYNESLLPELKNLLYKSKPFITKEVFSSLIVDLYNYCMHQEELGRVNYQRESFNIMNEMLKDSLPMGEDGYLSSYTYKSIAINALKLNEINWFNEFIYNYKNKVKPEERENSFQFCLGCYYNKLGSECDKESKKQNEMYRLALEYLTRVKPRDFTFMTILKNIQINIYYDLGEYNNALSVIASYRQYLGSNRIIPANIALRASNYIKSFEKLIRIRLGSQTNPIEKIKNEILEYKTVYSREELLKKVDELEKEQLAFAVV